MTIFNIEEHSFSNAVTALVRFAGTTQDDSEAIVRNSIEGTIEQILENFIGVGLLPSNLIELRVDLLNRISMKMKRQLTILEIQTLFRTTPSVAKNVQVKVKYTFAQPLLEQFLSDMREDAFTSESRPTGGRRSWRVTFHKSSTFSTAMELLTRRNLDRIVTKDDADKWIELAKNYDFNGVSIDLRQVLGLI